MAIWQPGEWEEWINSLLRARYPLGDYQQVPHEHGGDFGIEGFSTDGCAFQCYCPREPLSVKSRYKAHRDKITNDIAKFMANARPLEQIFGRILIRRWLLVVPRHDSGPLLVHAESKAVVVRRAGLAYVSADEFRIGVVTADYFAQERAMLGAAAAIRIHIPPPAVTATERDLIEAGGSAFLDNLNAKSTKLPSLSGDTVRQQFREAIMTYYVQGQVVLDRLRRDYPQVFEVIVQEKAARARQLEMESLLRTGQAGDRVTQEIQAIQQTIQLRFPNISSETRTSLSMEALSDWLLTCPLNFREVA